MSKKFSESRLAAVGGWNSKLKCKNPRCTRLRRQLDGWCRLCRSNKQDRGAFTALALPRAAYANEWSMAHKFVTQRFSQHKSVVGSIAWIDRWLSDATAGKPVAGRKAVVRLGDRQARGVDIFTELLAVSLYASTHENATTASPWLLSTAMLKAFKGMKRGPQALSRHGKNKIPNYVSPSDRKAIQKEIAGTLYAVIAGALKWWEGEEALRNAEIAAKAAAISNPEFPNLCARCAYNSRKAAEKRAARAADPSKAKENARRWNLASKENRKKKEKENDARPIFARRID